MTMSMGDKTQEVTFKLDETKNPKELDATETTDGQQLVHLGIYELKGDDLKLCYVTFGTDRPTEFTAGPGSRHILTTYKRVKPQ